jgi:hypothetical protein
MPTLSLKKVCLLGAAALAATAGRAAETTAGDRVQLPAYEVTAPRFTSPIQEFYHKLDNLFDAPWVDAYGSPLIQAIIWRHGFLLEHPNDEAGILIHQDAAGRVVDATTIYTSNGRLYANSYALGEHQLLRGLVAADLHNTAKVQQAIDGIRAQYQLLADLSLGEFQAEGNLNIGFRNGVFRNDYSLPSGAYTANGGHWSYGESLLGPIVAERDAGQVVPFGLNIFSVGGYDLAWGDRFHEPPASMLDSVYRALHDPAQAGLVPVALNRVDLQTHSRRGALVARPFPALVFDWAGVHYVYRPYIGTEGHPIPRNPVTGLPYLCVRDGGLMESIYFSATYQRAHPAEKVAVVAGDAPAAAYTVNGRLCLFSPALNQFALLKSTGPEAIGDSAVLASSVARIKAALAGRALAGRHLRRTDHLPEQLPGDTPDLQMRRVFVAFQEAGIPVHLQSGLTSSLTFSWGGVDYRYGPDQQLQRI